MSRKLLIAAATTLVAASALTASPAWGVPPANDTSAGATAASVGFSQVLDTTEATTDAQDAQLNETCGAPATDASVWYTFAGNDAGVIVDVSASDYPAGVLVGIGSPGNLETVSCGPGTVSFFAESGTTYYVLAIDDQSDDAGNGGNLDISFTAAPPPPTIDVTVDPTGTVSGRTGVAHLSGTYTCTDADFIDVFGDVTQPVGRAAVTGSFEFFDESTCDGTSRAWTADVFPNVGKFAAGKAMTVTFSFACGAFECADGFNEQVVKLRGGGR